VARSVARRAESASDPGQLDAWWWSTPAAIGGHIACWSRREGRRMQKTTRLKKLVLHKTTIQALTGEQLENVVGGGVKRTKTGTCGTQDELCLCKVCF
jgi:hypothetical protein